MKTGVLAHLFGCLPHRELARQIGAAGYNHVQLAVWKAISDVDSSAPGQLTAEAAQSVRDAFAAENVQVAILGCYLHMFDRNEEQRKVNIARFKELLRFAPDFGCGIVAFETGVNPGQDYTDADWSVMRSTLAELAEEAGRYGVKVGLEAADRHLVGNAQQLDQMLREVGSPHIGVVLDPGNLMNETNFNNQDEVIDEAFRLLGSRIIACHAKDRLWSDNGQLLATPAGFGQMNYDRYAKHLVDLGLDVPIIMEEAAISQMEQTRSFIEGKIRQAAEAQQSQV
ncbi:sugar phosphate isomerase/epimerase [Paenibacillus phyllosphaerae]|uniref:Sugar phosphate isomerase/epimerase n=1 Tax=Paenibacillus phyllosphaerae TaxID=274593 RepID=A0A7W5FQT0_9BACL|nr:sugar phosphate isomerase/epimerase [Paenibacillus phyllosphaerae]MBB3113562.1 sugar phosphate isomerase/epimerase [Paenibacillus phyllosphaerae]